MQSQQWITPVDHSWILQDSPRFSKILRDSSALFICTVQIFLPLFLTYFLSSLLTWFDPGFFETTHQGALLATSRGSLWIEGIQWDPWDSLWFSDVLIRHSPGISICGPSPPLDLKNPRSRSCPGILRILRHGFWCSNMVEPFTIGSVPSPVSPV